jgi:predicted small secreted protein
MKKSIALISVFAVLMIAFSGCVDNTPAVNGTDSDNPETKAISDEDAAGISTLETLPAGFEYIDTIQLSPDEAKINYKAENVSGVLNVSEGIYKDSNETNYYIDVIELENEEAANNFVGAYKASFKPLSSGSRFTDESFNGHSAVKILDYITSGGKTVSRYTYLWSNENYVIVVFGNTAEEVPIRQLAEATGY